MVVVVIVASAVAAVVVGGGGGGGSMRAGMLVCRIVLSSLRKRCLITVVDQSGLRVALNPRRKFTFKARASWTLSGPTV